MQECYKYEFFNECERICHILRHESLNDVQNKLLNIFHAKTVFKQYLRENRLYFSNKINLSPKDLHILEDSKHQKAKSIISFLSKEDSFQTDSELAMIFDMSLMECVQGKNKLHEVCRCMLCLKHCDKLIQSHIIPRSILGDFRKSVERYNGNKVFQLSSNPMKYFTDKTLTRNLLCKDCEMVLNVGGEQNFYEKFFQVIYDPSKPECLSLSHEVHYEEWLYHFFIGFIFRGIAAFVGIPNVVNDVELYDLFSICRKFLMKQKLSPLQVPPDLYMFINPTSPPTEQKVEWNHATLLGPATFHTAHCRLSDEPVSHCPKVHFIMVKIGIINVIVKLSPAFEANLPPTFMITPAGGKFKIPADSERFLLLPQGIKDIFEASSREDRKKFQDSIFRKDKFAPKPSNLDYDLDTQYRESFKLGRALCIDKLELQQKIEKEGCFFLNCLPPYFKLDHASGEVNFPPPFVKILHYHTELPESNFTVTLFIGLKSPPSKTPEPFVIYYEAIPEQTLFFGYTFNPEDYTVNEYISEIAMQDYPESTAERIRELAKDFIPLLFPSMIERCGFVSMRALLYHYQHK